MAHPFFNAGKYPSHRPEAVAFLNALSDSIQKPGEITLFYEQCGGSRALTPNHPRDVMWAEVLQNLTAEGSLEKLCDLIRQEFPHSANMQNVILDVVNAQTAKPLPPELPPEPHSPLGPDLNKGTKGILQEKFRDSRVESVKSQLNLLHMQAHDQDTFLRSEVFPILRGLFVRRNTFNELVRDCRDETWKERFVATIETKRLIEAYQPVMVNHAKPGDEELVQSYERLNLHSYLQELTGLFDPRPEVNEITERLRIGKVEAVKAELKIAEIHPKEKIDSKVIKACDAKQRSIRRIWMPWPII